VGEFAARPARAFQRAADVLITCLSACRSAASFIVAYTENVENLDVETVDLGSHKISSGEARARARCSRRDASYLAPP